MNKIILLIPLIIGAVLVSGCTGNSPLPNPNPQGGERVIINTLKDAYEYCEYLGGFPDYFFNTTGDISHIRSMRCMMIKKENRGYFVFGDCDYVKDYMIKKEYPFLRLQCATMPYEYFRVINT